MIRITDATITLVQNTAGNPPKTIAAQTVEIANVRDTISQDVDGQISIGRHPSSIVWIGGAAKELETITNVKIVRNNGEVLIDGELNKTYGGPRDVVGGVEFFVL